MGLLILLMLLVVSCAGFQNNHWFRLCSSRAGVLKTPSRSLRPQAVRLLGNVDATGGALSEGSRAQLEKLVNSHKILLFMKGEASRQNFPPPNLSTGTPSAPKCGFSQQVVRALSGAGAGDFAFVDVLEASNKEVRSDIKLFSKWATIPQLYVMGEFLGGSEIILEMYNDHSLHKKIRDANSNGVV
eukprot:GHVN01087594.1.p1 GENE.GHVN01087594.1~~GHVN01087594.1.p1  ORF type:complete len:186 (+),score=12.19 GHVN01087594.1:786-1343(+)